jgi:hypothetical protein
MKLSDVLDSLAWAEKNEFSLQTNRYCSRRDVLRAVEKGLAESAGYGPQCDADGFALYNRVEREGFRLTEKGREVQNKNYRGLWESAQ